jgi:hypothetical protein
MHHLMLTHGVHGRENNLHAQCGLFTSNKNERSAVRLGLRFEGQNYHYFKTLLFSKRYNTVENHRKLIQLGSNQVTGKMIAKAPAQ